RIPSCNKNLPATPPASSKTPFPEAFFGESASFCENTKARILRNQLGTTRDNGPGIASQASSKRPGLHPPWQTGLKDARHGAPKPEINWEAKSGFRPGIAGEPSPRDPSRRVPPKRE